MTGVDVPPIRLRRFQALTGFQGAIADGHPIPALASGTTDVVLSTMVIEHILSNFGHVQELALITRPGGTLYLTTVIRKLGA